MGAYNIVNAASLAAGQPEDVSQVLANFQAIQAILNGHIDGTNLLNFPTDATKSLRGDMTWKTSPQNITTSALAGGPPGAPADGDIWIASAVDANGTRWVFQYNAGSASAYKWEWIGGSPIVKAGNLGGTLINGLTQYGATGWWHWAGIDYATSRAGDYHVEVSGSFSRSALDTELSMSVGTVAQGPGLDSSQRKTGLMTATSPDVSVSADAIVLAVAAADVISHAMTGSATNAIQAQMQSIHIRPVRVT